MAGANLHRGAWRGLVAAGILGACMLVAVRSDKDANCQGTLCPPKAKTEDVNCTDPCYLVDRRFPFPSCKPQCDQRVCDRGYGVWDSLEACCSEKGGAFSGGCEDPPTECYVVESYEMKTCRRDDTQCLRGSNVYESLEVCCARGVAFPTGCEEVEPSEEECWVAQTDFPSKRCGPSKTQCSRGWKVYETEEECCEKDAAFPEGCTELPPVPCWIVDTYDPVRLCRKVTDVATCYRGWDVFDSQEVCCAKGAGFPEGCTKSP